MSVVSSAAVPMDPAAAAEILPDGSFDKRTVLITGVKERSIGDGTARVMLAIGKPRRLYLHFATASDRDEALPALHRLRGQAELVPLVGDFGDAGGIASFIAALGPGVSEIDCVLAVAGLTGYGGFSGITTTQERVIESVKLGSARAIAAAVLPGMIRRQSGNFVLVSSIQSNFVLGPRRPVGDEEYDPLALETNFAYRMANLGVVALAQDIAFRAGRYKIYTHVIEPGFIDVLRHRDGGGAFAAMVHNESLSPVRDTPGPIEVGAYICASGTRARTRHTSGGVTSVNSSQLLWMPNGG